MKHLSRENVKVLFDDILRTFQVQSRYEALENAARNLKKSHTMKGPRVKDGSIIENGTKEGLDETNKPNDDTFDARALRIYFAKCGKHFQQREIAAMMNESGAAANLDPEDFGEHAQVCFDAFYQFLTSYLAD